MFLGKIKGKEEFERLIQLERNKQQHYN